MSIGLPYMGSKRKIAKDIVDVILAENPNTKYVYDVFGGGGAVSFEFAKRGIKVYYNDLDTSIVELLKKVTTEGITKEFYDWVSREEFVKAKNSNDWKLGLIKTCWSFGNNYEKGYLYGKKIENSKQLLHNIIVSKCLQSIDEFQSISNIEIPLNMLDFENIQDRRLSLMKFIKSKLGRIDLEHLENINNLQNLWKNFEKDINKSRMLEHLSNINNVEKLQNYTSIEFSNKSYVDIIFETPLNETIIYCDPPYLNTEKYGKGICHSTFQNWVINNKYKTYVSSYEFPLKNVWQKEHKSTLSATNNSKVVTEKLFCNM
jgi:site-specific DNA-adenine methylase